MSGRVETAIRANVPAGSRWPTPTGRGQFVVDRYTSGGLVLLLGAKEAWTPLPWQALEEIPELIRGRGWVQIGSVYSTQSREDTLDAHLKKYLQRATAGWVAVILEAAQVIRIDRSRPARVKLREDWLPDYGIGHERG